MLSSFEEKDYDSLLTCTIDRLASRLHLQQYKSRAVFVNTIANEPVRDTLLQFGKQMIECYLDVHERKTLCSF